MARSFRRTPVIGNCTAPSDKPGKVKANRALRVAAHQVMSNCDDFDNLIVPKLREVSNVWSFPKDGKHRMKPGSWRYAKYMRK
jgi:hypothetical protein